MALRQLMKDLVLPVAIAVTLALFIQATIAKPYRIPTPSMDPTIAAGDQIIANRVIYHFRDISRGDIIVFHPTPVAKTSCGKPASDPTPYVKRVIGLPGDTVEMLWDSSDVKVNGAIFHVPNARKNRPSELDPQGRRTTFHVPADSLFVLGDNRGNSCDSHAWLDSSEPKDTDPFIPVDAVIGQGEVLFRPLRHFTFLD